MKKLLLIGLSFTLLIVGCLYGAVDSTKTQENNYKYILETGGKTAFYIIDYKIINDDIKITKDGENWEIYPLFQIKQIIDLNGKIIWANKTLIQSLQNKKKDYKHALD